MIQAEPKFDYQNFVRIDELLSAIHYKGISLTGVPGNFLKDTFITTPYYPTLKNLLLNTLNRTRLRYFQNFENTMKTETAALNSRPFLFAFTDFSARLMDFAIPVITKLGPEKCLVTTPAANIGGQNDRYAYHSFPCITKHVYTNWQIEYRVIATQVKQTIKQIKRERKISSTAAIDLETNTMYQTLLFENALDFLGKIKPNVIVCDSDRQATNCALVMAGKQLGIPTFTFIHGAIDPPDNYIPILTNYIFCWGNDHINTLKKINTPAEKMIVTGNTKLTRDLVIDDSTVRKKINLLPDKRKTLVLFTNNIDPVLQLQLAQSFINFCKGNPLVRGMIKLHPLESPDNYSSISLPENVNLYPSSTLSLDEALAVADGILAHNSLVGVDTLIKRKRLAILDTIDLPLGIAERLHIEANVPKISDQESFNLFVQSISENTYSFELKEKFVHNYCSAFGTEAVNNTINAILSKT